MLEFPHKELSDEEREDLALHVSSLARIRAMWEMEPGLADGVTQMIVTELEDRVARMVDIPRSRAEDLAKRLSVDEFRARSLITAMSPQNFIDESDEITE